MKMVKQYCIYKRKDGRFEGRIKIETATHSRKFKYFYGKTKTEVISKMTQFTDQNKPKKRMDSFLFSSSCTYWLEINKNRFKESTYIKYKSVIEHHIVPYLGVYSISALSTELTGKFSNYLLFEKKLSPKTVRDILSLLRSILNDVKNEYPDSLSPINIVYPKVIRKEKRILNKNEQKRMMSYLLRDIDIYKVAVILSLKTGIRIGELCGLKWKNICLEEKYISIQSTVQRIKSESLDHKTKLIIDSPKSPSSVRTIPLSNDVLDLLKNFYNEDEETFLLTGKHKCLDPRILQRRVKKYARDCQIKDIHFHTFRHTFATRCIEYGFDIKVLSEILGHSNVSITMNLYVHPTMDMKRSNMAKLNQAEFDCTVK